MEAHVTADYMYLTLEERRRFCQSVGRIVRVWWNRGIHPNIFEKLIVKTFILCMQRIRSDPDIDWKLPPELWFYILARLRVSQRILV